LTGPWTGLGWAWVRAGLGLAWLGHVLACGAATSQAGPPSGSALGCGFMHAAHGGPSGVGLWSTGTVRDGHSARTLSPPSAHSGLISPSRCLSFPPLSSSAHAMALPAAVHLLIAASRWLGGHPKWLYGLQGPRKGYGVVIAVAWGSDGDRNGWKRPHHHGVPGHGDYGRRRRSTALGAPFLPTP
jgi:hypothetical protein